MKIINPCVEYIPQNDNTLNGIYKQIEKAGRTCYKSEDKITEDSAKAFVKRMIESNHTAMLEHGTVYMKMIIDRKSESDILRFPWYKNNKPTKLRDIYIYVKNLFMFNHYSVINIHRDKERNVSVLCITTNYRVIIENGWSDMMNELMCEPTEWHTPRITLKFTTNIGVTREGNRMRANSIAEESTRYCNYSKNKFNNNISVVLPNWIDSESIEGIKLKERTTNEHLEVFCEALNNTDLDHLSPEELYGCAIAVCETIYMKLINKGWKPQQAREVLPFATKSDVVYTAFPHQWKHFFDLRLFGTTGIPHPNMKQIAEKARDVLIENNLWNLIYNPNNKNC